jgi:hypothetical protein
MWITVFVAEGHEKTKEIENALIREGFLIKTNLFSKESNTVYYEILAPDFEAQEVQDVLIDLGYI